MIMAGNAERKFREMGRGREEEERLKKMKRHGEGVTWIERLALIERQRTGSCYQERKKENIEREHTDSNR